MISFIFNFHNYILTTIIILLFTLCVYAKDNFPEYPAIPERPTLMELKSSLNKTLDSGYKNAEPDTTYNMIKLRGFKIFNNRRKEALTD